MTTFTTASGEVLTDEDIEALADEAERGYDLDEATKVTVGAAVSRRQGRLATRAGSRRPRLGRGVAVSAPWRTALPWGSRFSPAAVAFCPDLSYYGLDDQDWR